MNFEFSDEQEMLREQVRRLLSERSDAAAVRRVLESDSPMDHDLWRQIAELGWLATALPERYGGFGMSYLELCVVAEELGRAVAPIPFSSNVYLAMEALLVAGTDDQKAALLPKLAHGSCIGTLAVAEGPGSLEVATVDARFDGERLSGTKVPVPDGGVADLLIVLALDSDTEMSLFVVEPNASVKRDAISTIDESRSHSALHFDATPATRLGPRGQGLALLEQIYDRAAVLFSFEQLGGAQAALDMGVAYAKERFAFGRPIGSFQALKHRLAEMYCQVELARSNCYYGAWALTNNAQELPIAAATARIMATQANYFCAKENIQVHGGMGFTWEFDCHLYYRRSKVLGLAIGSEMEWKQKLLARLQSDTAERRASKAA